MKNFDFKVKKVVQTFNLSLRNKFEKQRSIEACDLGYSMNMLETLDNVRLNKAITSIYNCEEKSTTFFKTNILLFHHSHLKTLSKILQSN